MPIVNLVALTAVTISGGLGIAAGLLAGCHFKGEIGAKNLMVFWLVSVLVFLICLVALDGLVLHGVLLNPSDLR